VSIDFGNPADPGAQQAPAVVWLALNILIQLHKDAI
jgi:hypothetical protein